MREKKGNKNISLPVDILEDIEKREDFFGKNFSTWVAKEYRFQFMSHASIKKDIEDRKAEIAVLEEKLETINQIDDAYSKTFDRSEVRFMKDVPRRLAEGKEWRPLCNLFNFTFHKELSIEAFKRNVEFFRRKEE